MAQFDLQNSITELTEESYISQEQVARSHILGLVNSLKAKIEKEGFEVEYIQFYVTVDYRNIAKIEVKMKKGKEFDEGKIRKLVLEDFEISSNEIEIF